MREKYGTEKKKNPLQQTKLFTYSHKVLIPHLSRELLMSFTGTRSVFKDVNLKCDGPS